MGSCSQSLFVLAPQNELHGSKQLRHELNLIGCWSKVSSYAKRLITICSLLTKPTASAKFSMTLAHRTFMTLCSYSDKTNSSKQNTVYSKASTLMITGTWPTPYAINQHSVYTYILISLFSDNEHVAQPVEGYENVSELFCHSMIF